MLWSNELYESRHPAAYVALKHRSPVRFYRRWIQMWLRIVRDENRTLDRIRPYRIAKSQLAISARGGK